MLPTINPLRVLEAIGEDDGPDLTSKGEAAAMTEGQKSSSEKQRSRSSSSPQNSSASDDGKGTRLTPATAVVRT